MSTPTNIPETPMSEIEQDSFLESKEKFHQQLQDIFQTILRLTGPDQFDQLCQWMEYKQYLTIDNFYESSYNDPEKFDTKGPATEYKLKGKVNHISPNVAQKLKSFVRWMIQEDTPYELHDVFLATLTRESYLKFRHMDTQSFSPSSPSHHESSKLKTSFSGESKHQTPSESQTALNNFKKGTKRDASVYPIFKNDKYYDTFQRSFLATLKVQGSMMLLILILILKMVTPMKKNFSKESSPLYILSWLLHFRQKKGENWSRNLKEMPDLSFCNCITTTPNQMLQNMTSLP